MRLPGLMLLLIGLVPAPALAQVAAPDTQQPLCWLGSMSYSPGATARAGNAVMVCTADLVWEPTSEWSSGCLLNGTFYGIGAIPNASNQQQVLSECQPDGTWSRLEAAN